MKLLTDYQAAALSEAIDVAEAVERSMRERADDEGNAHYAQFVLGQGYHSAETAGRAVFDLLNTAANLGDDPSARAVLDGRRKRRERDRQR